MKFLAIDASTEQCSVTLSYDGAQSHLCSDEPKSHSKQLLPFIDQLLTNQNAQLTELDFIACAIGPGSFTGLRIAFATSEGLAYSTQLPLIGIPTLEAVAVGAAKERPKASLVVTVLDARMGELYWSAYEPQEKVMQALVAASISPVESMLSTLLEKVDLARYNSVVFAGPGVRLLKDELAKMDFSFHLDLLEIFPSSRDIAVIAEQHWNRGVRTEPGDVSLMYLRDSVSWNKRIRIRTGPN